MTTITPHAVITRQTVFLKDFFDRATKNIEIPVPSDLFFPDEWTKTFAAGLQKLADSKGGLHNKTVVEVGVGTGVNMAGLLNSKKPAARFIGSDLCPHAVANSLSLAKKHGWAVTLKESDLLTDLPGDVLASADHIVACIPQVPSEIDLHKKDNAAHYYTPTGSPWDAYGLGLNAKLLQQASIRAPQATVTLNLAGRPSLGRLKDLFNQFGYGEPQITHQTMVPQHAQTSLASLAQLEVPGHEPFEFFADKKGCAELTATQAEERRLQHAPIFHKVYVLTGPALQK